MNRRRRLKVYFDGGCRPNPGVIEVAVVARGATYFFDDLGCGTSSDAEGSPPSRSPTGSQAQADEGCSGWFARSAKIERCDR
jgi:hypothetical protein